MCLHSQYFVFTLYKWTFWGEEKNIHTLRVKRQRQVIEMELLVRFGPAKVSFMPSGWQKPVTEHWCMAGLFISFNPFLMTSQLKNNGWHREIIILQNTLFFSSSFHCVYSILLVLYYLLKLRSLRWTLWDSECFRLQSSGWVLPDSKGPASPWKLPYVGTSNLTHFMKIFLVLKPRIDCKMLPIDEEQQSFPMQNIYKK